jgi:hypothetical protein
LPKSQLINAHGLLQVAGASSTAAIAAASLVGPAQVGAHIVEFDLLRSFHPISSARLASVLHPVGAAFLGAPAIIAFALLHGASEMAGPVHASPSDRQPYSA